MIDVTNYLNEEKIILDLPATNKEEAIKALTNKVFLGRKVAGFPLREENVFAAVMERENQQTTGIGSGLAFPHARIEGWKELSIV
ncbi:MAG: PTS sugar transporter subunit IIA, partial [Candidatus Omnitrophota bacterium]